MSNQPWHDDPSFWADLRGFLFPPEKVDEASAQVDDLLGLLSLPPGARVLDLPCGVGRHAVELAKRGFDVTGVDATDAYLETARERTEEADVDVEFRHSDMRTFEGEGFDAVFNLYTSFGYFADPADDERTARTFHDSLNAGGVLVMSLASKELLARDFRERTWEECDGAFVLEEHAVTDDWSWLDNRWVVADDDGVREYDVSHRVYSAVELTDLLGRVGFDNVSVYGDFEGREYDQNADRLVAVARK